jgi:peroxiredoxin
MSSRRQPRLIEEGSHAPDFQLPGLAGGELPLADLLSSGPVLLAFFKVTCPICQMTFPYLDRIHASGRLPIYAISQNDPDDTREFNRHYGVGLPTLLDTEEGGFRTSNDYGISSVPTLFLIERDGTVSRVIEGWIKKEIEALGRLAGVPVFRSGDNVPEWKAG